MTRAIDVLLFDLGGVLVEFSGIEDLRPLLRVPASAEEVRARWLACADSNAFGMGRLGAADYAQRFVSTWDLAVAPADFLAVYRTWTRGWLPGATTLLGELRRHFRVAALTNCNEVHWDRLCGELRLLDHVDLAISSHQVGCRKPDPAIYRLALERLGVAPSRVVFFDDAAANVDAARSLGMEGFVVDGPSAVRDVLEREGLLPVPR